MRLETGQPVDRYLVEGRIGEGGMATVYRVRHATLGTVHALKILHVEGDGLRKRLVREGQLQATLRHPNIVAVSDVIDVAGTPALLMEYIEGPTLRALLAARKLAVDDALALFRGITSAVAHAHRAGLIHRDLKPENVLLATEHGRLVPKVTDFGIVKALTAADANSMRTRTGTALGTPAFMSPEQINDSSAVDRRADLWALGCILYDLVCGKLPFVADDILALLVKIGVARYTPPRDLVPDLPDRVVRAIAGLLQPDPERRISDCIGLLRFLDGEIDEPPIAGVPLGSLPPPELVPPTLGVAWLPATGEVGVAANSLTPAPTGQDVITYGGGTLESGTDLPRPAPVFAATGAPEFVPRSRFALALPLGAGAAGLVGLLAVGIWATRPVHAPPRPAPRPPVVAAATAPDPIAEAPVPAPVPAPAPVLAPAPLPPAPGRSRPAPAAVAPVAAPPSPVEAPTPVLRPAHVTWTGASRLVFVDRADKTMHDGPSVPPGDYTVRAVFPGGDGPIGADSLHLGEGEEVALACDAQMQKCVRR
jgi:serine/threonine-protein kinase